jgi:simple sugar transport system permease protein
MLSGGLMATIHAFVCIHLRAQQVISGTAINLFSTAITSFLIFKIFNKGGQTDLVTPLPFAPAKWLANIPVLGDFLRELNWFVFFSFLCVALVAWLLFKTALGLRIRSIGEHPKAADTLGVNVNLIRYGCVIASGVLAGIGGVALSLSATPLFIEGMIAGRGFIALAAVVFGKWRPLETMLACFIFGFADAFQILAQGFGLSLPTEIYSAVPYVMSLAAMIIFAGKAVAPKACGVPYVR